MVEYNTGCMPNTEHRYEEFEALLGSLYLSLRPLRDSVKEEDHQDYQTAMRVLNGFAKRYNVQLPEETVNNPREHGAWGTPSEQRNLVTLDSIDSFIGEFNVGSERESEDYRERCKLEKTILRVFDRYDIARVKYAEQQGQRVPAKFKEWREDKDIKTLADFVR